VRSYVYFAVVNWHSESPDGEGGVTSYNKIRDARGGRRLMEERMVKLLP
jgi:hypothetical protein